MLSCRCTGAEWSGGQGAAIRWQPVSPTRAAAIKIGRHAVGASGSVLIGRILNAASTLAVSAPAMGRRATVLAQGQRRFLKRQLSSCGTRAGHDAGLDDVAMMREPIKQGRRHLRVSEDRRPFAEGEVGRRPGH